MSLFINFPQLCYEGRLRHDLFLFRLISGSFCSLLVPSSPGHRIFHWRLTVAGSVLLRGYPYDFHPVSHLVYSLYGWWISGIFDETARSFRALIHRIPAGNGTAGNSPSPVFRFGMHRAEYQNIRTRILFFLPGPEWRGGRVKKSSTTMRLLKLFLPERSVTAIRPGFLQPQR